MRGRAEPDLRDRLEYLGLVGLLKALRAPGPDGSRRWGLRLGSFAARRVALRREVALENLRLAFPEMTPAAREEVYLGMYRNLGAVLADFARLVNMPREEIRSLIPLNGVEHVEELARQGRGGFLIAAHYGNWECLGATIAARGFPVTALGARQRNPLVEGLFSRYRASIGMEAVTVRQGLRPIVSALKAGRLVATLADQDGGKEGFFIEFLGRPASVQSGLFRLAARLQVPIVTGFSVREERGWRGEVQPPIHPLAVDSPEALEAEARRLAEAYTRRVEAMIRERPDHWFWVHRRWKSRPPGEGQSSPGNADNPGKP